MRFATFLRRGSLAAALTLGLLASLAVAQDAAKPVTLTGCVAQTEGGQIQIAAGGVTYALATTVENLDLGAHVGHTVELTGTPGTADPEAEASAPKPFNVTALKMIKDSCGDY